MDSNKFGVKLKCTGEDLRRLGVRDKVSTPARQGTATKTGNFQDIKKLFDAKDGVEGQKKTFSAQENQTKINLGSKMDGSAGVLYKTRKDERKSSVDESEPQVAVSKVFTKDSSRTFHATVENKLHHQGSRDESPPSPRDKEMAASLLKANLALIRTRPGSGGKKEERTTVTNTVETKGHKLTKFATTSSRTTVGKWGGGSSSSKFGQKSSSTSPFEFGISYAKKTTDSSHKTSLNKVTSLSRQSSSESSDSTSSRSVGSADNTVLDHKSVEKLKSALGSDFNTRNNTKVEPKTIGSVVTGIKGIKSETMPTSTLLSSSESKSVSSINSFSGLHKKKNGLNQQKSPNISKLDATKVQTWQQSHCKEINTSKEELQPEWMSKSKEMVSKFQTKLKPSVNTSNIHTKITETTHITKSDTGVTTTVKTKMITTDINSNKMASKSLENKNPINLLKSVELSDTGSDISSRSSEISSSSWKRDERVDSLDSIPGVVELKTQRYASRKMDSDQFKKIKGNFEQKSDSAGSTDSTKVRKLSNPKVELTRKPISLPGAKNILERRNSLEQASSPPLQPRNATLRVLRETGKIPNVKAVARDIDTCGRVRSSSLGSIDIQHTRSASDQEYNDFLGFEEYKPQEWLGSSDSDVSEGFYEPVGPERLLNKDNKGPVKNRLPTRRLGQKRSQLGSRSVPHYITRKGTDRPELQEPQSSTEGSSRECTLESQDERGGVEADAENDSDSSNSEIYESIDQAWASNFKPKVDDTSADVPPELPAVRTKKKHTETSGAKALGKLKKFYKPKKKKEKGLTKVVSAPVLQTIGAVPSTGVLNKIGDKLKNLKKTKSDTVKSCDVEVVIESSDYDATDQVNEDSEPLTMTVPLHEIEYIDSSSSLEHLTSSKDDSKHEDSKDGPPPPLPPRTGPPASSDISSGPSEDDQKPPPPPKARALSGDGPAPVVPPRKSMIQHLPVADSETPALPPRNSSRISTNLDINMVVPVSPGIAGAPSQSTGDLRKWNAGKESYLHGHNVNTGSLGNLDNIDGNAPVPPPPRRSGEDDNPYLKHDPQRSDEEDQYKNRSQGLRNSSAYLKMQDVSSKPDKSPTQKSPSQESASLPFSELLMFRSQYEKEEDNLYLDLEDDNQLYGTLDQRYEPKIYADYLYQDYDKDKVKKASSNNCAVIVDSDEDDDGERIYEEVPDLIHDKPQTRMDCIKPKSSTLDTFAKTGSILRSFWCEMPEVKESGFLSNMSSQERKIQEAMFEIVTSEATYLRSLNVLIDVFLKSPEFSAEHSDRCVITRQERHVIFSNIGAVREASERFLASMEAKWQKSVMMDGLSEVIELHASKHFECYVRYCSNQTFQERSVQTLMKKPEFLDAMRRMEKNPLCQGLPMISFLLLPMQRITRLPLLVDAICHRMEPATDKHKAATKALDALNKVVRRCNDGARKMQQTEQMYHLVQSLEFKVKEIPLVSASRYLIKQGELTRILPDASSRLPLRKKIKQTISVFLFNDVLLISKKKSSTQYVVTDYALRNVLQVENIESQEKSRYLPQGAPSGYKNLFVIIMLENHDQKVVELVLSCKSPSDKTRWVDALSPAAREDDAEKIYEEWDCPQVQCTKKYTAREPDELSLEESDVVNVFKKMADGWYEGERIRDGERGWFPAEYTEEIINSHVRARNLRLRYRLLLASQDYGNVYSAA